jgi:hypothetical protein
MPERDLLDNDIVFKISCFGLNDNFKKSFDGRSVPYRLGLASFVLPKKIARSSRVNDKATALRYLEEFFGWAIGLEPTENEFKLAAEIEEIARELNVPFDTGESQLLAVLLKRGVERLYTGDKRAIVGVRLIAERLAEPESIAGKIICFERVLLELLQLVGDKELVEHVCREPAVDRAAAICCGCASGGSEAAVIMEGLQSYIRDLQERSGLELAA